MTKLCFLILILILLATKNCTAQNLVSNGDFEFGPDSTSVGWTSSVDSTCFTFGSVAGPDDWAVVSGTPDRLIEGDITCDWDNIAAQSGKAFIDFVSSESGKTILKSPLEVGSVYQLSYFASWQTFQGTSSTSGAIEFRFNNNGNNISSPDINNLEWQHYNITFIAIANSSELKLRVIEGSGVNIDNITLEKIDTIEIQNYCDTITFFPNPCETELNILTSINEILEVVFFDASSKKVLHQKIESPFYINMEGMANGIYFYEVRKKDEVIKTGKVIKI